VGIFRKAGNSSQFLGTNNYSAMGIFRKAGN
jgi:hypothetical protein